MSGRLEYLRLHYEVLGEQIQHLNKQMDSNPNARKHRAAIEERIGQLLTRKLAAAREIRRITGRCSLNVSADRRGPSPITEMTD